MTIKIELKPHEIDLITTALITLGGSYNKKAEVSDRLSSQLYRAKADDVFRMVCALPSVSSPECCSEIAEHDLKVSEDAWGVGWFCV